MVSHELVLDEDLDEFVKVLSGSVDGDSQEDFLVAFGEHGFELFELEFAVGSELLVDLLETDFLRSLLLLLEDGFSGGFGEMSEPLRRVGVLLSELFFGLLLVIVLLDQVSVGFEHLRHLLFERLGELGLAGLEELLDERLVVDELGVGLEELRHVVLEELEGSRAVVLAGLLGLGFLLEFLGEALLDLLHLVLHFLLDLDSGSFELFEDLLLLFVHLLQDFVLDELSLLFGQRTLGSGLLSGLVSGLLVEVSELDLGLGVFDLLELLAEVPFDLFEALFLFLVALLQLLGLLQVLALESFLDGVGLGLGLGLVLFGGRALVASPGFRVGEVFEVDFAFVRAFGGGRDLIELGCVI